MDQGIQGRFAHVLRHQIQQAVFALVGLAVEHEREALLEVGVVLHHALHKLHVEGIVSEHLRVRGEADISAVFFGRWFNGGIQEDPPAEMGVGALAVAVGSYIEVHRHGVYGFGTHTVHAHALLEVGVVKLSSGVELGSGVHHFVKGNAAPEVPHRDRFVLDGDVDALAEAHGELVDGVVHDFLQEHIDTISLAVSVAQSADIHARPAADMLVPFQGLDGIVVVGGVYNLCHSSSI